MASLRLPLLLALLAAALAWGAARHAWRVPGWAAWLPVFARRPCPPPRRVLTVSLVEGGTYDLCMPRYLPPRLLRTNPSGSARFVRTYNDTCGLYGIVATTAPDGVGPGPHYHLADDEWFLPAGEHDHVRVFLPANDAVPLRAGQLPGINVPPVAWGSAALPPRTLAHSPPGVVHTWRTEGAVAEFLAVWGYGFAMTDIILMSRSKDDASALSARELLMASALHGVPATPGPGEEGTGLFVGDADWPRIRAPARLPPSNVARLQALFDAGEACFPGGGDGGEGGGGGAAAAAADAA